MTLPAINIVPFIRRSAHLIATLQSLKAVSQRLFTLSPPLAHRHNNHKTCGKIWPRIYRFCLAYSTSSSTTEDHLLLGNNRSQKYSKLRWW